MIIRISALALTLLVSLRANESPKVEDLKWLAGCLELRNGERVTEQQWMTPRGGVMIGMSRTKVAYRRQGADSLIASIE